MLKFTDCVKEGLLRRVPRSEEKAEESIKTAKRWLEEAEKDRHAEAFNSSVLSAYLAFFHAARSLLFLEGYREKSHYCIARFLEEKYVAPGLLEKKWVNLLDHYREIRHDNQYSVNFFTVEKEATSALRLAQEFVKEMEKLLQKIKTRDS